MVETYPGLAHYVWNNRSAPLLATFLSSWLTEQGFDGDNNTNHKTARAISFHTSPS